MRVRDWAWNSLVKESLPANLLLWLPTRDHPFDKTQFILKLDIIFLIDPWSQFISMDWFFVNGRREQRPLYTWTDLQYIISEAFRYKFLPMTGFKPRASRVRIDRSTNWATTTSQVRVFALVTNWLLYMGICLSISESVKSVRGRESNIKMW